MRVRPNLFAAISLILLVGCDSSNSFQPPVDVEPLLQVDVDLAEAGVREFIVNKQNQVLLNPKDGRAVGELAMAYEMNGFANAALQGYVAAAQLEPQQSRWPYFAALLEAGKGEFETAISLMQSSVERDPSYSASWLWIGQWSLDQSESTIAQQAYEKALSLGANLPAQVGLVNVHIRQNRLEEALDLLVRLDNEYEHRHIDVLIKRVQQRLGLNEDFGTDHQLEDSRPPTWEDERSQLKRKYAVSLSAKLDYFRSLTSLDSEAIELVKTLYQEHPNDERVVGAYLLYLRKSEQWQELTDLLPSAWELWPDYPVFNSLLAEISINKREFEEAIDYLNQALVKDSGNHQLLAQRGLVQIELGLTNEAKLDFQRSLGLQPSAEVYFYLGNVLASQSDWIAAKCHFESALKLNPELTAAQLDLDKVTATIQRSATSFAAEDCQLSH